MANAKKCDRCGEFYEKRPINCKTINSKSIRTLDGSVGVLDEYGFIFDLCPACFHKLMDFLHIEEVKEG